MGAKYRPCADRLFPYWDYPGKAPRRRWDQADRERHSLLVEAYRPLLQIGPLFEMQGSVWTLPMTLPALDSERQPSGTVTLTTYRQVYDFIDRNTGHALRDFRVLYGESDA